MANPQPEPRVLTWLSGMLVGMNVEPARKIGDDARAAVEPTVGRLGATLLGWGAFALWIIVMSIFVTWFCRRPFVRAWFERAEMRAYRPPTPPSADPPTA